MIRAHDMPFGAHTDANGDGTRFRLWAPTAARVHLRIESPEAPGPYEMTAQADGWFGVTIDNAGPGTLYRYAIDDNELLVPDPASRFQPRDVHGPSAVVDPRAFDWQDDGWRGRPWSEAVFYELHVGAFTAEGTFAAAIDRLEHLAELGVTAIELMPVADWPGGRNWGYDGAYPFAPDSRYGTPDDLKTLIQACHARELMVFLDVVYNHFGPEGNYLHLSAPGFFTERYHTPWGAAINFDGADSRWVRAFFVENALYWIHEYHVDGLRLDAVHAIFDQSHPDILTEIAKSVRARIDPARHVHLVLENDNNAAHYMERAPDGAPKLYAAQWNDDIHHVLHHLITGEASGYYADYAVEPARKLGRALAEGFAYQGEPSPHRGGAPRGEPSGGLPPSAFVSFLQNHDQVGNRAIGERIGEIAPPEAIRAALAVVLLAPSPPLLFMGEEWGSKSRFPFFCDFGPELADAVRDGRRKEFAQFPEFRNEAARARIPDPNDPETFASATLDWPMLQSSPHREWLSYYKELLEIRRREIVPRLDPAGGKGVFGLVDERALWVRWRLLGGASLTCLANLSPNAARSPDDPPDGHLVFATHERAVGAPLAGWSVAWFVTDAAR